MECFQLQMPVKSKQVANNILCRRQKGAPNEQHKCFILQAVNIINRLQFCEDQNGSIVVSYALVVGDNLPQVSSYLEQLLRSRIPLRKQAVLPPTCHSNLDRVSLGCEVRMIRIKLPHHHPIHTSKGFRTHRFNVPVLRVIQWITDRFESGTLDLEPHPLPLSHCLSKESVNYFSMKHLLSRMLILSINCTFMVIAVQ